MNKTRMLSFRLDAALLRKVDILRISRHRTRGEIIREALEMYFRVYNPVLRPSTNADTAEGQNSRNL
jgi:hypothetical protein